jgi:hypothetical protein
MDTTNIHEAQANLLFPVVLGLFNLPILDYNRLIFFFQEQCKKKRFWRIVGAALLGTGFILQRWIKSM